MLFLEKFYKGYDIHMHFMKLSTLSSNGGEGVNASERLWLADMDGIVDN